MRDVRLLSTIQVARLLGCGSDNVRTLARLGRLPVAAIVGRDQRLFDADVIQQFAREREARHDNHGEAT
jgi:excisionase family DNA binding protein